MREGVGVRGEGGSGGGGKEREVKEGDSEW